MTFLALTMPPAPAPSRHSEHLLARTASALGGLAGALRRGGAQARRGAVAVAAVLAVAAAPLHAAGHCAGLAQQVLIEGGTGADHAAACEGFARALGFFARLGLHTTEPVTIRFTNPVVLPVKDAQGHQTFVGGTRVVGMFDPDTRRVTMTSLSARWLRQRPYFKLPYDRELLVSVLAHESAHALSKAFYRYRPNPNTHAQEEYIAYAAQLSTMAPAKRRQVLRQYPGAHRSFSHEMSINDLVHAAAPHAFGVMSYIHFQGPDGGGAFLDRVYSGDFKPVDLADLN